MIQRTGHNPLFCAGILPEPALELGAHRGADRDARVERNSLHRHFGTALLCPPSARMVRPWHLRQGIRSVWLAQKRLGGREEGEVLAEPSGARERVVEQGGGRHRGTMGRRALRWAVAFP